MSFLERIKGKMQGEERGGAFSHGRLATTPTHTMFSRIAFPLYIHTHAHMHLHAHYLRCIFWILLEERNRLERAQEVPQEWNLVFPRLEEQKQWLLGDYWMLQFRSPSSLTGWVPAHPCWLWDLISSAAPFKLQ